MSDETRRLTRCLTFIKENTSQVEKILDKLIEDEIIGMDERALILTKPLIENQLHAIIETVIRKQAHQAFLRALQTTGNSHVVDKIMDLQVSKDPFTLNKEKTFIIKPIEEETEEKAQKELLVKEKTLEELKSENDRLKTQQSIVREKLNEKTKKIQELKLEIQNYKRQNTEMKDKLVTYEELQSRMVNIEEELLNKEKMNKLIEMALCERSEEIHRLQRECDELKNENEDKKEQIALLSEQMESLKIDLTKASHDRKRLEETIGEMSNNMDKKFNDMMTALTELKNNRQAQVEVTTPRGGSSRFLHTPNRAGRPPVSKNKAYILQASRSRKY